MDLFSGLNPQQRSAVEARPGPVLVLAGPGSGKTRVLTHRAAYLVAHMGVAPYRLLAVTFTNKAAREMRRRLEALLEGNLRGMWIGTFHASCARLLRRESGLLALTGEFVIYDESDQLALVKRALADLNLDDKRYRPASMLAAIGKAKNELILPENLQAETYFAEVAGRVYTRYQELLRANNGLDFDDLLMRLVLLFRDHPDVLAKYQRQFEHILVDEFQDTNTAQYALLRQLAGIHRNLFVVGDADQCFPAGTQIQTPNGPKPIERIRVAQCVTAAAGRGAALAAPVSHVEDRPYQGRLIRVTTRRGFTFEATPNHIVFARGCYIRKGRRKTWPVEFSRLHYADAQVKAQELSRGENELEIVAGAFLLPAPSELPARRFDLMPVSHLRPSMIVAVEVEGQIAPDEVVKVEAIEYRGRVYDLEVDELHNYIAGGVVVHNSIYRWRGADYRNVHRFQDDYPDALTILLEQNYRSTQTILDAAMAVIDRNVDRTPKRLFTHRPEGEHIYVYEAYNEVEEAQFVIDTIASLTLQNGVRPGDCAIMYRTNAQSRTLEEAFVAAGLPYKLVGATKFYARQEIKDLLAYLRLVHNPADTVSLQRIINVPRRGIGGKAVEALFAAGAETGRTPAEILRDLAEHKAQSRFAKSLGRAASPLANFGLLFDQWLNLRADLSVLQLLDLVIDRSGYEEYLRDESEAGEDRWENVLEFRRVASQAGETDLTTFLEEIALVSDVDNLIEDGQAPTLMTLHAAKGLEFGVVFIVGLDEGVLPHQRSLDEPEAMAEERRLMYVGLTRAKDHLYLIHSFRRSLMGSSDLSRPSRFLDDLPAHLISGNFTRHHRTRPAPAQAFSWGNRRPSAPPPTPVGLKYRTGQRVNHASFGEGLVVDSQIVGDDEEVIIAFETVGIKRLAAAFANLEILNG